MSHPISEPKPDAGDSLALLLKTSTQDLHDQAESGDFQKRMVDGTLLRAEFVAFLQQALHVHRAIEPNFRDAARREPRFEAMLQDAHFRAERIEQDLADLDAEPTDQVLASTQRFVDYSAAAAVADPLALLGVLYVNEGATNGNKIVAKRIRDGLSLEDNIATRYLDPHGPEQRKRWTAFKAGLDQLDLSDTERARCVEAARATFRLHMELSAELHRAAHAVQTDPAAG